MTKQLSRPVPGGEGLLDASVDLALTRVVEGPAFTRRKQPMGRDTSRPYPGEALLHRLSEIPDRLADAVGRNSEPHIPGLAPQPEPEQIDMRLMGQHHTTKQTPGLTLSKEADHLAFVLRCGDDKPITYDEAKAEAQRHGYKLQRQSDTMEYRLAPTDGTPESQEARAYYASDIPDAIGTLRTEVARAAARNHDRER